MNGPKSTNRQARIRRHRVGATYPLLKGVLIRRIERSVRWPTSRTAANDTEWSTQKRRSSAQGPFSIDSRLQSVPTLTLLNKFLASFLRTLSSSKSVMRPLRPSKSSHASLKICSLRKGSSAWRNSVFVPGSGRNRLSYVAFDAMRCDATYLASRVVDPLFLASTGYSSPFILTYMYQLSRFFLHVSLVFSRPVLLSHRPHSALA